MKRHSCIKNRIYITCDKACDVCDYEGIEDYCPIIMYGVCEICGNPIRQIPDLPRCLKDKFQDKLIKDRSLAVSLYASICNQEYIHKKTGYTFFPTWRCAGGIVADIRDVGEEYTDFYCSGGENGVYKKAYKLIKKCGWVIRKYTLTERIDYRIKLKETRRELKARIKENEDSSRMIKLFKFLLKRL